MQMKHKQTNKNPDNLITDIFALYFSKKSIYVSIWADIALLEMHTLNLWSTDITRSFMSYCL